MATTKDEGVPIGREIGLRLEGLRKQRGWTQGQLAIQSQTDQSTLSQLLSGGRKDPPIGTVLKVAGAFGVTLDQLVGISPLPEAPAPPESSASDSRIAELERRFDDLTRVFEEFAGEVGTAVNARIEERQHKKQGPRTRKRAG